MPFRPVHDRSRRIALLCGLAFGLTLGAASLARADDERERFDKYRATAESDWLTSENAALGIRHAVILFDGTIIDDEKVWEGPGAEHRYVRVRVFDRQGIDDLADVELIYEHGERIRDLAARTVKPDGRMIDVAEREFHDREYISVGRQRLRSRSFAFPSVEPGDILEYRYRRVYDRLGETECELRHAYYCLESSVVWRFARLPEAFSGAMLLPDEAFFDPRWIIVNAEDLQLETRVLPDEERPNRLEVIVRGAPAIPEEKYAPPHAVCATRFLGHYYFPRLDAKAPFWERVAEETSKQLDDFFERRKLLRPWMQPILDLPRDRRLDQDRCLALVQAGLANWDYSETPSEPSKDKELANRNVDDVLKRKGGTGADLSVVCAAMLAELGHGPRVAWVADRTQRAFYEPWLHPSQFDFDAVCLVDSTSVDWLFPGLPVSSAHHIPWQAQGSVALLLDAVAFDEHADRDLPERRTAPPSHDLRVARFVEAPLATAVHDTTALELELRLDEDGALAGRLRGRMSYPSDPLAMHALRRESAEGRWKLVVDELLPGIAWEYDEESSAVNGLVCTATCSLTVNGLVEDAGPRMLIQLGRLRSDDFKIDPAPRQLPLEFAAPHHYRTSITLQLPAGWAVEALPAETNVTSVFGAHTVQWSAEGDVIQLTRQFERFHSMFLARAAGPLESFFDGAAHVCSEPVVLVETP